MKTIHATGCIATIAALMGAFPALADITLGVFPRRPVAPTYTAFKPLAQLLSKQLGEKVVLMVPKDMKTFWKGVAAKKYDLVHYNQYHYIKSHKQFGYRVIVTNEEFGHKTIEGALSVRKDSGIKSLADLKGKTILFGGGKMALVSYMAPTAVLKKAGLVAGRDYTVKFAKNPPSAVIGAYNKAADAAGAGDVVLKLPTVISKIDISQMSILAKSAPLAHLPWAVKDDMPAAKADAIRSIMSKLKNSPQGLQALKAAKITNFHPADDADFNGIRKLVEFVTGEKY